MAGKEEAGQDLAVNILLTTYMQEESGESRQMNQRRIMYTGETCCPLS